MSAKHVLTLLFFCAFALPAGSVEPCDKNLVGKTCLIKLPNEIVKKLDVKKSAIEWKLSSDLSVQRKEGQITSSHSDATMEPDGSLMLKNIKLSNTGKYTFEAYDEEDSMIASYEKEITVYAQALKPSVKSVCKNGSLTLTCDTQKNDKRDLSIIWMRETEELKKENKADLTLAAQEVQQDKKYSCRVKNPVSNADSDPITASCAGPSTGETLWGFDFWIMVGILSGGGALLLLLVLVLVICACRSCNKHEKLQDEEELRLRNFDSSPNKQRSKVTARGQPAPAIPQGNCLPETQTPPQTKGPVRARPPPPPQEGEEEEAPPLPRPRKKQHRDKRTDEPYRIME